MCVVLTPGVRAWRPQGELGRKDGGKVQGSKTRCSSQGWRQHRNPHQGFFHSGLSHQGDLEKPGLLVAHLKTCTHEGVGGWGNEPETRQAVTAHARAGSWPTASKVRCKVSCCLTSASKPCVLLFGLVLKIWLFLQVYWYIIDIELCISFWSAA